MKTDEMKASGMKKDEVNAGEVKKSGEVEAGELINYVGREVLIHGSVYKIRRMSGFAFLLLRTRREIVQCIYTEELCKTPLEEVPEEACVIMKARVVGEQRARAGYELHIIEMEILSRPESIPPVIINQKEVHTSLENLLDYRPLTLRNERERAIFKIQAGICKAFREFLDGEGFTEIHTPKIVAAGAEGGANIFQLSYFGKNAYLAQSPQFYKQMMVGVFERVYEVAPVFRAEKHDTSRHLNEYTSMDLEMGYIRSFEDIMEMETNLLRYILHFLNENFSNELNLLEAQLPEIHSEIPKMKFMEAKDIISKEYHRPITDYLDFEPEEEKLLCAYIKRETGSDFVFVTHYPSEKRPFYTMDCKENPKETNSFDLLFRGLEITTGGQRIHDYKEQLNKIRARGMREELFESYMMMHKQGMPPHGGLGIGLERLTAMLLGFENVRRAALFPRDINRLEP